MVKEPERAIILDENADTAAVVMAGLEAPDEFLPLTEKGKHLKVGNEVGWVGFPAVASAFFYAFSAAASAHG